MRVRKPSGRARCCEGKDEDEMKLCYREHEIGPKEPRMRVWNESQAMYKQFEVLSHDEFKRLEAFVKDIGRRFDISLEGASEDD